MSVTFLCWDILSMTIKQEGSLRAIVAQCKDSSLPPCLRSLPHSIVAMQTDVNLVSYARNYLNLYLGNVP
jgi:hypothetical protein